MGEDPIKLNLGPMERRNAAQDATEMAAVMSAVSPTIAAWSKTITLLTQDIQLLIEYIKTDMPDTSSE